MKKKCSYFSKNEISFPLAFHKINFDRESTKLSKIILKNDLLQRMHNKAQYVNISQITCTRPKSQLKKKFWGDMP